MAISDHFPTRYNNATSLSQSFFIDIKTVHNDYTFRPCIEHLGRHLRVA